MKHLKKLRFINRVMSVLSTIVGVLFLVLFVLPGFFACSDGQQMGAVFMISGVLISMLFFGLGIVHWVVGWFVGVGRGRFAQTCLAIIQIATFPIGTAYALYALWVCWLHGPSKAAFDDPIKGYIH